MQQVQVKTLLILITLNWGCASRSRLDVGNPWKDRKDVLLLAILLQDYLRNNDGRNVDLDKLNRIDSSGRISKNFAHLQQVNRGGHIAVLFRFSDNRNPEIDLTAEERQRVDGLKMIEKEYTGDHDGEIQYEYGERFYRLRKIIVSENSVLR